MPRRNDRSEATTPLTITPELLDHIARVVQDFGEPDGRHVYKFREGQPQQIKIHRTSRRTGSGQRRR